MIGERLLASLPARLEAALAQAAQEVAERAQELAPAQSGSLRSSIQAQGNSVTATAPHAAALELGTQHTRAQPFLRPALLELRERITQLVAQTIYEDMPHD